MKLPVKVALSLFFGTILISFWTVVIVLPALRYFIPTPGVQNMGIQALYILVQFIVVILFSAIPITWVIWAIVFRVTIKQIMEMNEVAKMIATGNLSKHIEVKTNDEVGELATNFNTIIRNLTSAFQNMADSLKETRAKEADLAANVKELEQARLKTIQVLEDLNKEKVKLEEAKAKDEALLKSIGDGIIATDQSGMIIFVNSEAENMLGFSTPEMVGRNFHEVVVTLEEKDKKPVPSHLQPVQQALVTKQRIRLISFFVRKNRSDFPVAGVVAPVITGDQVSGTIVVFRDITKEKEIDRMKTEFISLASHQLRTPLSAIRWFVELLLDEADQGFTNEQKELLKNISDSADRMVELVNALLNISRIESGRIIIDPKPTDLVELVRGVIKEVEIKSKEKQQSLIVSAHEQLPMITVDPKLIRQVYMNLLTNAIKYSPNNGQIVIFISRRGDQIISQISDSGYGIPLDQQSKVFQKFFRAENAVKIETDGNGLGLYLVKAIIESSQGKIWFKSEEGKGTTFWFSLPLVGVAAKQGEVTLDS